MAKKIRLSNGSDFSIAEMPLSASMYKEAENKMKTFSQLLEEKDPSPEGCPLDAFERQLFANDIQTKTIFTKKGDVISASKVNAFFQTDSSRVLFPEFINREVRMAISEDVMLGSLLGNTRTIPNGSGMVSFYIDDQTEELSNKRVVEGTDIPISEIKGKDKLNKPRKYAKGLKVTYEYRNDITIDMLSIFLRMKGIQMAKDMTSDVIKTIVDGDGTGNAATVYKMKSDLDASSTVNTLSAKAFLMFLMKFKLFPCTTLVASEQAFVETVLTMFPSMTVNDVLNMMSTGTGMNIKMDAPQLPKGQMKLFWHSSVTGNKIIGLNQQNAIERLFVAGSDVQEEDRVTTNQTYIYTMSERDAFAKIFNEATAILDLAQ